MYLDEAVDRIAAGAVPIPRPAQAARPATAPSRPASVPDARAPAPPEALAQARALAAAAKTLDELAAAIEAFEGCPLKFEGAATKAVFSRGAPSAPVMVVGEGPGTEEDARGQPFVGRAGRLLDKMVAAAGLQERVFITNTVFWRPPGNRTPTPAEQAVCAPFVERAIELVQPRLLLLLDRKSVV